MSASDAASRCGASNSTAVRRSATSACSRVRRSPALRGRKPSKQKRSLGRPLTASAVVTADGPGTQVTGRSCAAAAATSRYPGSLTVGIPASVTSSTRRPARTASSSSGHPLLLVALEAADDPAGRLDAEVGAEPVQAPGVLGGDDVGRGELRGQPAAGVAGAADRGTGEDEGHATSVAGRRAGRGLGAAT